MGFPRDESREGDRMIWQRVAIWRTLVLVLLGACFALSGWIYVRDRPSVNTEQWGRQRAQLDAERILSLLGGAHSCHYQCAIEVLGPRGRHSWRVQLTAPSWQRCFDVDVSEFGDSAGHGGLSGLRSVSCR
jgi:hypothetical protein